MNEHTTSSLYVVPGSFVPAPCQQQRSGKHCWHASGAGTSYWSGGTDEGLCCYCGVKWSRKWILYNEPVEGHGKFHTISERYYLDEEEA